MINRYKLVIEYLGTNFCGWQKQKNHGSIQETIELSAKKLFQEDINLVVAGRTDAGVHAEGQVAHFETTKNIRVRNILLGLNYYISKEKFGEDISIKNIKKVSNTFNARRSVIKKIYKYQIYNKSFRSPLNIRYSWWVSQKLNIKEMKRASIFLIGKHDFTSFRAVGCQAASPVKTIEKVLIKKKKNMILIEFIARSFLYNQVRIMTGTLKDVGTGLINAENVKNILDEKNRKSAGITAPARGLTLVKVNYK